MSNLESMFSFKWVNLKKEKLPRGFLCLSVVKASEVGARSAVIAWRATPAVYHSYKVLYQAAGEETKVGCNFWSLVYNN